MLITPASYTLGLRPCFAAFSKLQKYPPGSASNMLRCTQLVINAGITALASTRGISVTYSYRAALQKSVLPCNALAINKVGQSDSQTSLGLTRHSSTFTQMTIDQLWDGCSGVSNAGKKRGRGKRGSTKKRLNLSAGKTLGYAKKTDYQYPGLNSNVLKGSQMFTTTSSPRDPEADQKIIALRDQRNKKFMRRKAPLERGWTGAKVSGQSFGSPSPVNDYTFEEFDSKVLEYKLVSHMTSKLGRYHRTSALVVVGNKQGLVGVALAKATVGMSAIRKAKNMAIQRLQYIDLKDDRTIYHNFHVQVGASHVFAAPKPEGYGVVCHRALKTVAECIGIKDLYCKVEGRSKNVQNVVEAFLRGLRSQENHQALADRTNYNVVELSENYQVPKVLAKPSDSKVNKKPLENFDLIRHYYGGKTVLRKGKRPRFYENLPSFHKQKMIKIKRKNQYKLAVQRQATAIET